MFIGAIAMAPSSPHPWHPPRSRTLPAEGGFRRSVELTAEGGSWNGEFGYFEILLSNDRPTTIIDRHVNGAIYVFLEMVKPDGFHCK